MGALADGRPTAAARKLLRSRWGRWTAIVEAFALRRPSRRRVDPAAYRALYGELIDACRSLAGPADGEEAGDPWDLEGLVRPWISPASLAQADREILEGLLARCRQVERDLGGRAWPPSSLSSLGRGIKALPGAMATIGRVVLVALALVGLVALLRASGVDLSAILDRAGGRVEALWMIARRSGDVERLGALAILVIPAAIFAVRHAAKG